MDAEETAVRVAVRIRPVEQSCHQATAISFVNSTVVVTSDNGTEQSDVDCILVDASEAKSERASQEKVFQSLGQEILRGAMEGISQGLIVYGASGSGKTFTVLGTREEPGLLPRLTQALLEAPAETRVWFSSLEVFDDQVQDLLASQPLSERRGAPSFVHHPTLGVQVVGATEVPVEAGDIQELVEFALKRRALGRTCLHSLSSRSSQVYCLRIEVRCASVRKAAKICLFDLAAPTSTALPRAECLSLAALHTTVQELCKGSRHGDLFFGASPLTLALRDALEGSWRTTLVATLLAGSQHAAESADTLRFARAIQPLRTRPAVSKMRSDQLSLLQDEVAQLRKDAEQFGLGLQLKIALDDRSSLIADFMKQAGSQGEERRKLSRQRAKALEWCGLLAESSKDLRRKDETTPHLLNMSDDPVLAGCLLYFLPRGERTSIGSDLDSTIVFDGLGILPNLCSIINQDDKLVNMARPDFARRHVLLNGKTLSTSQSVVLSHADKICLGRAQLLLLAIPLQNAEAMQGEADPTPSQRPLQDECKLPEDLAEYLPTLEAHDGELTFEKVSANMEHSDSLKYVQCYVKDLLPKLPAADALACFVTLHKACYLLDEANLITREVRPEDHMHFQVELIWDIERTPEEVILVRLLSCTSKRAAGSPMGAPQDCQVLHYWTYRRFLEKLDYMRDVHRLHCQGVRGWTGRCSPLHDPWLEPTAPALQHYLLTNSLACKSDLPTRACPSKEAGAPAAQAAAAPGDSTVEADEQRRRIRELVQELEDKNSELEEKSLIVSQLKEQMAQIIPLVGGLAPAGTLGSLEGLVLEQPEPEAPCRRENHRSQPSDAEHSCTMTVSASTSEGGFGAGEVRDSERSRGFRVDNFGVSKGHPSGAVLLSQSSLTPPHCYRDLRR